MFLEIDCVPFTFCQPVDRSYGSDSEPSLSGGEEEDENMDMDKCVAINDSALGTIRLPPLCVAIVNTPEFQRLRYIKQCGCCEFVYPTATHNRFSHSLGVCQLAGEFIDELNRHENLVSREDKLCVQLAGLCHDLGHGPFSHLWEKFVHLMNPNDDWGHETSSVMVLKHLIDKNNLSEKIEAAKIELCLVTDLILGDRKNWPREKYFLFEIVANKETGVDVDKWEYLIRDNLYFGLKYDFHYNRILSSVKVMVPEEGGERHIGYRDKLAKVILEMFEHRAKMHSKCYQHRVTKIVETMFLDALIAANDHFFIKTLEKGSLELHKMSVCHKNVEAFLKLTDSIFEILKIMPEEELENCNKILNRIMKRQLYFTVGCFQLKHPFKVKDSRNHAALKEMLITEMKKKFQLDFHVEVVKLDLGDNIDPLANVRFYNREGRKVQIKLESIIDQSLISLLHLNYQQLLLICKGNNTENKREMEDYAHCLYNDFIANIGG